MDQPQFFLNVLAMLIESAALVRVLDAALPVAGLVVHNVNVILDMMKPLLREDKYA